MNKAVIFLNKAFVFLCLIGLLLGSSNLINSNNSALDKSQKIELENKKDFKLKSISFEATINCIQIQLQQFFYVNFYKPQYLNIKIKIYKLITQNIATQFKVILFSKIIPSQAP